LNTAINDLNHVSSALADSVEKFYTKKITDIQSILHEFIYSEIQFHAKGKKFSLTKALEILSNIDSGMFSMNMESDIYEIKEKLRSAEI
jgi:ArsR family metal-binding transcriptional regulator